MARPEAYDLSDAEKHDFLALVQAGKPLPKKHCFVLLVAARKVEPPEFEERWTSGYIFENEWQSFRTRQDPKLN